MTAVSSLLETRPSGHRQMHPVAVRALKKRTIAALAKRNTGWTSSDWAAIRREIRKVVELQASSYPRALRRFAA